MENGSQQPIDDGTENILEKIEHHLPDYEDVRTGKRFPRWLRRLVNTLLLLILIPVIIFQIPWVQSKLAKELTTFLSKELNTTVSIERVYVGIFNKVTLENFYLADLGGDTLIHAGQLKVNHSGLYYLLFRKFNIESVALDNAEVCIAKKAGQKDNNFQFVLDYFAGGEPQKDTKPGKPFHLNLRHFYLNNVHFVKPDEVKGEVMDLFVKKAEGHFSRFDLINKRIEFSSVQIDAPDFKLTMLPQHPFPETGPPVQLTAETISPATTDTNLLVIKIKTFDLNGGRFSLKNIRKEPVKTTPPGILNYNYLNACDIEVHVNNFTFSDLDFHGEIEKIAFRDSTGFELEKLSAKDASLTCKGLQLYGLDLKTPFTRIGDTLVFKYNTYHAWESFIDDVKMEGRFHDAFVALKDIMVFAPDLRTNTFFKENANEVFQIDGMVKGAVNRLDGRDLKINLAEGLRIEGNFSTRNLAVKDEQFLHFNLDRLRTDVKTLRKLIPDFRPPENFDRLGKFDFTGKFDGFFVDFVADGTLKTDIGSATMFMNLKLRDGKEKARYSGDLLLKNFDLGAWSGNPDAGKITFSSHVKEGRGLTLNTAQAKLDAIIDSISFKGYKYKNVAINGQLQKNQFDGQLNIEDQNINFNFQGEVNFSDTVPAFNFKADIKKLALKPLNISKADLQFNGKVDLNLKGKKLSDIVGQAKLLDFRVIKNKADTLLISSAVVSSTQNTAGEKHFTVNSNLGMADIKGHFDIEKIPGHFMEFLSKNYPGFAGRIGIKPNENFRDTARFEYSVELYELQNMITFLEEKLEGFDRTIISGAYDGFKNELSAVVEVPLWSFQNIEFKDVYFRTKLDGNEGELQIGIIETRFGDQQKLSPVSLIGTVFKDTLEFLIISSNFFQILDNINLNGVLTLEGDDAWRISFKPSDLVILNQIWEINTANYLRIGKGSVETNNFVLSHADQRIVLKSVRNEGLEFQLKNYPLDSLDFIKNLSHHRISGTGDLYIKAKDVFKFEGLSTLVRIDNLTVNGDNYGVLRLDASAPSIKETVNGFISIQNDSMELALDGYFNPPTFIGQPDRKRVNDEPNYFDFDLSFSNYPVRILNYFVADVSNVRGAAGTKKVRFFGTPAKPQLSGEVNIKDAAFTINTLRTTYRMPDATIKVTNTLFDGTGNIALDRFGNKALVFGGITHDHLKNFGLDVQISTETGKGFLGMETTAKDNPIFYGTAIGSGYARFTGDFNQPALYVNGRTMSGSRITIPITNSAPAREVRFISFPDASNPGTGNGVKPLVPSELRGLNMEFDLELTQDAVMEMIFDKAWGDVLRGTGNGNLKVIITREGRFDMYGNYVVASGDYLFTMMNLVLNKPFTVEPGGTVTWSGDPFDATINVAAVYKGLNTSVYNFIGEFVEKASPGLQSQARTSTPVDLKMNLKGSLMKPDIDFDIDFPSLDSELRNYAENKMRLIRQDPNELNRQVFGLLVLGQFMPSGYTIQAQEVGINTLSEMLSNQFSIFLTEFISELIHGNNFIQGIDLDISYNRYSGGTFDDQSLITGNELQGRLKVIVNDRVSVHVGGNFDVGGGNQVYATNSSILASEIMVEYVITKDRRLKIRAYNSTEADIAGGRRSKIGAGISFRKEFDNIADLLNYKKKKK